MVGAERSIALLGFTYSPLSILYSRPLLKNLRHHARADRASTFANRKAQTLVHRDRGNQLTTIFTLSPGITISTPSGSSHAPVTSVVRK
jgi:hypothetical protein